MQRSWALTPTLCGGLGFLHYHRKWDLFKQVPDIYGVPIGQSDHFHKSLANNWDREEQVHIKSLCLKRNIFPTVSVHEVFISHKHLFRLIYPRKRRRRRTKFWAPDWADWGEKRERRKRSWLLLYICKDFVLWESEKIGPEIRENNAVKKDDLRLGFLNHPTRVCRIFMAGKICGRVQNTERRMMPIRADPKPKISDEHFMLRNNNRSILFSSSLLYLAARCKIDVGPQSTMPFFSSSSHSTSETFWDQVHTCVIGHARV